MRGREREREKKNRHSRCKPTVTQDARLKTHNTDYTIGESLSLIIKERVANHPTKGGGQPLAEGLRQLLYRNVQRFRGGLIFKGHRLCVSLKSRLESNKEEGLRHAGAMRHRFSTD